MSAVQQQDEYRVELGEGTYGVILQAAASVFARKGFHHAQMHEIAAEANVAIGTVYRYFKGKQELLQVLLDAWFQPMSRALIQLRVGIETEAPLTQITRVEKAYRIAFATVLATPDIFLLLVRYAYGASPEVDTWIWNFWKRFATDIAADLLRAESVGLLESGENELVGHAIVGQFVQVAHAMIAEKRTDVDTAVQLCLRMTMGAMFSMLRPEVRERFVQDSPELLYARRFPGKPA